MRTILSWSTGKDSAYALHVLRQTPGIEVVGLLTTINEEFDRVAMHGIRRELVEAQAKAAGLPLHIVPIPNRCINEIYEQRMGEYIARIRGEGVEAMAFGDLFLEEIRDYREQRLQGTGIRPLFPLWLKETRALAREMVASGLKARLACLDPKRVPRHFIGRDFDASLLGELPIDVDPCGENGEFHTFAYAGPMFGSSIPVVTGEAVDRDGFTFIDLIPGGTEPTTVAA